MNKNCLYCDQEFYVKPSADYRKSGKKFCTAKCYQFYKKEFGVQSIYLRKTEPVKPVDRLKVKLPFKIHTKWSR